MTTIKEFSRYIKPVESKICDDKCHDLMENVNKNLRLPKRYDITPPAKFKEFINEETYRIYNMVNHKFVYSDKYGCWGYVVAAGRNVNKSSKYTSIHLDVLIPSPKFVECKDNSTGKTFYKLVDLNYVCRTTWTYKTYDEKYNLVETKNLVFEDETNRELIEKFFIWDIKNEGYVTNNYLDYIRNSKRIAMPYQFAFDLADSLHYNIITNLIADRMSDYIDSKTHYNNRLNYKNIYKKKVD